MLNKSELMTSSAIHTSEKKERDGLKIIRIRIDAIANDTMREAISP